MKKSSKSALSDIPIYRQVVDSLTRDIRDGKYALQEKLPSEAALLKRFQTSRITIGRALRELKQKGMIKGVAGSGNFVIAGPKPTEGLLFGLLIPNLGDTAIFETICQGMAAAPEAGSYALLWGHTAGPRDDMEAQALQLCRQFIHQRAAGVFFAPLEGTPNKDEVNQKICALLDAAEIPVVLLDRCILPYPQRSKYDLVGIDNRRAGYMVTNHLLETGSHQVAFIALAGAAPTVEARIAGFREAVVARGQALQSHRVFRPETMTVRAAEIIMEAAWANAFVCANDRLAGEFLQALRELGYRVPQDVRVAGIDDVEYSRLLPVPLTTVHQPGRAIGAAAIAAMFYRRQHPDAVTRDILLECHLVVRGSTG